MAAEQQPAAIAYVQRKHEINFIILGQPWVVLHCNLIRGWILKWQISRLEIILLCIYKSSWHWKKINAVAAESAESISLSRAEQLLQTAKTEIRSAACLAHKRRSPAQIVFLSPAHMQLEKYKSEEKDNFISLSVYLVHWMKNR